MRIRPDRMPQALAGGDILSMLLGDAKKDISGAMVREADSYFHGGVDMDCSHLHDHDHGHDHDCAHDHGREAGNHKERSFDPWRWINSHIRAPEIDRHLSEGKAVEMMPWFWVAIKADPHNVEAWSMAWYVALHMMKDDALALRIASEGWWHNPNSMEMAYTLGRSYRAEGTRDLEKSEEMFRTVVKMAEEVKELADNDYLAFFSAVGYLADSAKHRNDTQKLTVLLDKARRFAPNHLTTHAIERMLEAGR